MRKITGFNTMRVVALGALSLFISGKMRAQDSIRIDLQQALEIALSDNPTVKVADNTIELKKFVKYENIGTLLPNVSLNGTFNHSMQQQKVKIPIPGMDKPTTMGPPTNIAGQMAVSLPLIAPQVWKTIQLTQKDMELAMESARSSKIDMVNQVKTAYYSLLLAQDAYQALLTGYNNAALNAKIVTDKYNQGIVSEYDKLVADVQLRNQKPQVVNGENAIRLATMQLKVLMGIDVHAPIIFTGNLNEYESEMFADLMKLQSDTSLTDNSQLKQLDIQKRQLELSKKINLLGYAPTLGMSLNAGWYGMGDKLKLDDYFWTPTSGIALTLSIPVFSGGQKYYKNKQNKVSLLNLDLQRENIVRQLELSVTNSLNSIETAVEQVSSNKESVTQAEKAFMISQKRYEVGSGTLLEMNSSETALTQARLQYAQSIFDYLSARATLEATLGRTVPTINNKK
ncbi:MAG: TolC family protein [Bacteroidales bacterium]